VADIEPVIQIVDQQKVMRNIAEDIKLPLQQIIADVQVGKLTNQINPDYIETTADAAIKLLDSFIISTQIYNGQRELELEPVSVAAVMQDTAHYLYKFASMNNCELQIINKRKSLAMANVTALQAALVGLAHSFITASTGKKELITFTVDKKTQQINAGIFSTNTRFLEEDLHQIRRLKGKARQLVPHFSHASSAGILIADTLFASMNAPLKSSRSHGLVAGLLQSQQLAIL